MSDDWDVQGGGFGNFLENNLMNRIIHYPELSLSDRLLKQYQCHDRIVNAGKKVAEDQNRLCEFDCVKQMLSLSKISKGLQVDLSDINPFVKKNIYVACVIGDGYGYFTSLLKFLDPELKIISVNLGRTLFFDVLYTKKGLPDEETLLLTSENYKNSLASLNFCEAERYELLCDQPVDLFINIASMQEMDPVIIRTYFNYMRQSRSGKVYFYCCNRERKVLPDGTVSEFSEYPWDDARILLDELCPWYQKFPTSIPPFWKPFDGPTRQRLVRLK
ncbi:MAG: putative sugar O-methyltransferase [Methanoregula sp.]|jgi:hypothetical protein|nr:putative sugar O-methyltransferase [Methanoregula sp.]